MLWGLLYMNMYVTSNDGERKRERGGERERERYTEKR